MMIQWNVMVTYSDLMFFCAGSMGSNGDLVDFDCDLLELNG